MPMYKIVSIHLYNKYPWVHIDIKIEKELIFQQNKLEENIFEVLRVNSCLFQIIYLMKISFKMKVKEEYVWTPDWWNSSPVEFLKENANGCPSGWSKTNPDRFAGRLKSKESKYMGSSKFILTAQNDNPVWRVSIYTTTMAYRSGGGINGIF